MLATNEAFQLAGEWHWSKKDDAAKKRLQSEKKAVLMSYGQDPEFSEKFLHMLEYYMDMERYMKEVNIQHY